MLRLFQDSFILGEATSSNFFRVTTWTQQLPARAAISSEQLFFFFFFFFLRSSFFRIVILHSSYLSRVATSLAAIAETFNNFFANITKDLGIFNWADDSSDRSNNFARMSSFSNHSSIQMIKDKYQNLFNLKFELVSTNQVIKCIEELDCNKI